MDRIDRLISRVKPKLRPWQRLEQDNPYLGKECDELLNLMDADDYQAPEMRTREWDKFVHALVSAFQKK